MYIIMKTPQERIEEVKKKIIEESHQITAFTYQIEEADLDEAFETLSNTIHEDLAKEVKEGKKSVREMHPEATLNTLDEDTAFFVTEKEGYNQSRNDIATLCRSKIIK